MKKQDNRQQALLDAESAAFAALRAEKASKKKAKKEELIQGTDFEREYNSPKVSSQIGQRLCEQLRAQFPGIRLTQQTNWTKTLEALDIEIDGLRVDTHIMCPRDGDQTEISISIPQGQTKILIPNSEAYKKEGELNQNYLDQQTIKGILKILNNKPDGKKKRTQETISRAPKGQRISNSNPKAKKRNTTARNRAHTSSRS